MFIITKRIGNKKYVIAKAKTLQEVKSLVEDEKENIINQTKSEVGYIYEMSSKKQTEYFTQVFPSKKLHSVFVVYEDVSYVKFLFRTYGKVKFKVFFKILF